jgi:hypothetical protein
MVLPSTWCLGKMILRRAGWYRTASGSERMPDATRVSEFGKYRKHPLATALALARINQIAQNHDHSCVEFRKLTSITPLPL